jgi:putative inorganic carbon (hco3(-)) transporter
MNNSTMHASIPSEHTRTQQPPAIEGSKLFKFQECAFQNSQLLWQQAFYHSRVLAPLHQLFSRRVVQGRIPLRPSLVRGILPALGVLALLAGCTLLGTGSLGAGVVILFMCILVFSALSGKALWWKRLHVADAGILLFFATYFLAACFSSYEVQAWAGLGKQSIFLMAYLAFRALWVEAPGIMRLGFPLLFILGLWQTGVGWMQSQGYAGELAGWTDADTPMDLQLSRVYGTLQPLNPNLLAAFLLNACGAGTWVLFQLACAGLKRTWPWVLLALGGIGVILYGILLTGCRGAYVGSVVLLACQFLFLYPMLKTDATANRYPIFIKLWAAFALTGAAGAIALIIKNEKLQHRFASIFAFRGDSSISYRFNVYQSCWRMFQDNWLTGIGPSNTVFKKVYGFYMVPGFNALGAYSIPLEIMVEQGVPGFMAFVASAWVFTHGAFRHLFHRERRLSQKLGVLALATTLLAIMSHGLVDTILYRPPVMLPFMFTLSALATWIDDASYTGAMPVSYYRDKT